MRARGCVRDRWRPKGLRQASLGRVRTRGRGPTLPVASAEECGVPSGIRRPGRREGGTPDGCIVSGSSAPWAASRRPTVWSPSPLNSNNSPTRSTAGARRIRNTAAWPARPLRSNPAWVHQRLPASPAAPRGAPAGHPAGGQPCGSGSRHHALCDPGSVHDDRCAWAACLFVDIDRLSGRGAHAEACSPGAAASQVQL